MRAVFLVAALSLAACTQMPQQRHAAQGSDMFAVPSSEHANGAAHEARAGAATDLLWPAWRVAVTPVGADRFRLELRMRTLVTGSAGEARQVFGDGARHIVEAGGYSGYRVLHYEEGIDSGFLFGRRSARGEILAVRSEMMGR